MFTNDGFFQTASDDELGPALPIHHHQFDADSVKSQKKMRAELVSIPALLANFVKDVKSSISKMTIWNWYMKAFCTEHSPISFFQYKVNNSSSMAYISWKYQPHHTLAVIIALLAYGLGHLNHLHLSQVMQRRNRVFHLIILATLLHNFAVRDFTVGLIPPGPKIFDSYERTKTKEK